MGEEAEATFDEGEYYAEQELWIQRETNISLTKVELNKMQDAELINYLCEQGEKLDTLETFKTYTIAKRLRDNGWTPTPKQREALINTAAIALNP